MKKILFVIDSLNSGGAEKSLVTLLNSLDLTNYEVDLLLSIGGGLYSNLVPSLVNTKIIPCGKNNLNINRLFFSLSLRINYLFGRKKIHPAQLHWLFLSKSYIKNPKVYDVAIAYSQGLPTYYVSDCVNAKYKYCWVNTNYSAAGYKAFLDKYKYAKYRKIVVVSDDAKKIFQQSHQQLKSRTQVIYDLISEDVIQKMANQEDPYDKNNNCVRILTIGRLVHSKGYDIALDAALELKNAGLNFKWHILGEGNLEQSLRSKITKNNLEKNIVFLGTSDNPYPFIKYCDIYCQTSRFEGFGLAIAEARALNKPIVSTNFDVVKNQLIDGQNGIITEMNGHSVARGIQKLLNDPSLYKSIENCLKKEYVDSLKEIKKIEELINV